jgi:L-lactate dehydrogenase complex protein LldG
MSSRETILNKLRQARPPFPDAPPRPKQYQPVALVPDESREGLIALFSQQTTALLGEIFVVDRDEAACKQVLELLHAHQTTDLLAWDFAHIPVAGLKAAIETLDIAIHHPETHDEYRGEVIESIRHAQVGLTGADAAIAATGTLIVSTGPGKGRIPTVLAPNYIVVIEAAQILPRLENWVAQQRTDNLSLFRDHANVCFISGPSRTGDIEMTLILGVHGPGRVQIIVKR